MRKQTENRNRGWLPSIVNRLSVAAGVALVAGLLAGTAGAATVTWNGSTSVAWENSANWTWSAGGPGYPGSGDDVVIDGAGSFRPTLDLNNVAGSPYTINSLSVGATTAETLTFKNCPVASKRLRVTGNVTIGANGKLTHTAETATGSGPETQQLYLDVGGNLTVTGTIDVGGRGYSANNGPAGNNTEAYGAGHGGQGGSRSASDIPKDTYGSATNPVTSGSGGNSGAGGGTVKLTIAGDLILNGTIGANAQGGQYIGEAGGSVNITAGTLTGSGTVSADGSDRTSNDGGKPGGGDYNYNGSSGASGGGGVYTSLPGTNNAPGQGNNGGAGWSTGGDGNSAGGGGGGYSGVGQNAASDKGGDGGVGLTNSLTGYALSYAGGGGGGKRSSGAVGYGKDGGGNGVRGAPTAGAANSGGGGGGNGSAGGAPNTPGAAGGSGIVIITYALPGPPQGTMILLR